MRILLTGASSFTGYWFARELSAAGHEVIAPLRRAAADYEAGSRRAERVRRLSDVARVVSPGPFGSEAFLAGCGEPFDLLCHHAARVEGYRDEGFDVAAALAANTRNLVEVLRALGERGLKGVVLTGSVFEQDEGAGDEPRRAVSPYGLSKGLTSQVFRYWCERLGLSLGKFVIPNPFGPWEEARFCDYLMSVWLSGGRAAVRTPAYVRDNIHVDLLAKAYARFVPTVATTPGNTQVNPSGYVESQGDFARRFAAEIGRRLNMPCQLDLLDQIDVSEPMVRVNTQPAAAMAPEWSETAAWDAYAEGFLTRTRGAGS